MQFVVDPSGFIVFEYPTVSAVDNSGCKSVQDAARNSIWFASPYKSDFDKPSRFVLLKATFGYPVTVEAVKSDDSSAGEVSRNLSSELQSAVENLQEGNSNDAERYFSETRDRSIPFIVSKSIWMRCKRTSTFSHEPADLEKLLSAMPENWVGRKVIDARSEQLIRELSRALETRLDLNESETNRKCGALIQFVLDRVRVAVG